MLDDIRWGRRTDGDYDDVAEGPQSDGEVERRDGVNHTLEQDREKLTGEMYSRREGSQQHQVAYTICEQIATSYDEAS